MDTVELAERVDDAVRRFRDAYTIPGMAVAVTGRDRVLIERTYGHADVERVVPVTPATLFEIGSIGKTFTACCALRLVDEGRLDLYAPVTAYLPWFSVGGPTHGEAITVHHLLSHTAGISRGADITSNSLFDVWALRDAEATLQPGAMFWYSNVGYRVVGAVLEAIEGRPYPDLVQERVLDPVGMTHSAPAITARIRDRLAVGYGPWPDDRPALPWSPMAPAVWLETGTADGSVASTAADLAAFLRMLMNGGAAAKGRVLAEPSVELMFAPAIQTGGGDTYGYGLERVTHNGTEFVGHGGSMVGFVSSMYADGELEFGATVLVNGMEWGNVTAEVARHAVMLAGAISRGEPQPDAPNVPSRTAVPDADRYVGRYGGGEAPSLDVVAEGDGLVVRVDGGDVFAAYPTPGVPSLRLLVPDSPLDRFALTFDMDEEGAVVAATNGSSIFPKERAPGSEPADGGGKMGLALRPAQELDAFVGHFESSNPWTPHVRIARRGDHLVLCERSGMEIPMVHVDDAAFAPIDASLPERVRFDAIVDGKALRATFSGERYYRSLTD